MHASGYLANPDRHPVSLALALAMTGGGLAALLLVKPVVFHSPIPNWTTMTTVAVPKDQPPLPRPPKRTSETLKNHAVPSGARPDTTKNLDNSIDTGFTINLDRIKIDLGGNGDATKPANPPADPVLIGASLDPRFAREVQPPYPAALERMEIEGAVTVRVQVDTDGRVIRVEAVQSDNDGFLAATRDWALRHWRFRAATRDGVPVVSWQTKTVRFQLNR